MNTSAADIVVPASKPQERLWHIARSHPDRPVGQIDFTARITGALDYQVLGRAVAVLGRRYEVLRAHFELISGEVHQVIARSVRAPLTTDHPPVAADRGLSVLASRTSVPFDLGRAPLWRVHVLELDDGSRLLSVQAHHSILDGFALGLLVVALADTYNGISSGAGLPRSGVPSWAAYLRWRRERQESAHGQTERRLWRAEADKLAEPAILRGESSSPVGGEAGRGRGEVVTAWLPAAATDGLERTAREALATPFAVVLACVAMAVAGHNGTDRVSIAAPQHGRGAGNLADLMGMTRTTLPMVIDVRPSDGMADVVARARDRLVAVLASTATSYEDLGLPSGYLVRPTLFHVQLNFVDGLAVEEENALALAGAICETVDLPADPPRFVPTFHVSTSAAGVELNLTYDSATLSRHTASRVMDAFARLMRTAAEQFE